MVSALFSNRPDPNSSNSNYRSDWSGSVYDWQNKLDHEQMFKLIDSILSFEACLYHQVLPLSIEGSRLNLGMVNPDDVGALEYVRRIVAYVNYSLVPRQIPSEIHQNMLSAYLNYVGNKKQTITPKLKTSTKAKKSLLQDDHGRSPTSGQSPDQPEDSGSQATFITDAPDISEDLPASLPTLEKQDLDAKSNLYRDDQATLITDLQVNQKQVASETPSPGTGTSQKPSVPTPQPATNSTSVQANQALPGEESNLRKPGFVNPPKPDHFVLPVLEIKAKHLDLSLEDVKNFPPEAVMHELLARALSGGIGRLFFERQQYQGRILWSQNGALKGVLEGLTLPHFQGVLDSLKRFTGKPISPVQKPCQVEIERSYQACRILLRLRIMPGTYGEEATLQVLRGAALKFHQEQQFSRLGQDVLGFAQQLQRKLDELDEQVKLEPSILETQQEALSAIEQLLTSMSQKIRNLSIIKPKVSSAEE